MAEAKNIYPPLILSSKFLRQEEGKGRKGGKDRENNASSAQRLHHFIFHLYRGGKKRRGEGNLRRVVKPFN